MKLMFLFVITLLPVLAEEPKPTPTIESLQAENALLRAQLEVWQKTYAYENRACWSIDLMQARFEAADAQKKLADLTAKTKPVTPEEKK